MEFEEMQKVWMADKQEAVYVINEKALHNRVISKKNKTQFITNVSELLLIIANVCAAGFILGVSLLNSNTNVFLYITAAWMLITSVYVLAHRMRRLNEQPKFDRSIREDLQHAIDTATYQVRLSKIMRLNILPIGVLSILGIWKGDKSLWLAIGMLVFFVLVYYASGWEHGIYKNKKRELELLQNKLEKE